MQRVLIHGINRSQIDNGEEENLGAESHWSVIFTSRVNFLLRYRCLLHSLLDFVSRVLGNVKHINELIVFKNGRNFFVLGQTFQNLLLNVSESTLGTRILLHDKILFALQIGHFLNNERVKHLFFETTRGNRKVQQRNLDLCFWGVVRVGKRSGHKEFEFFVVRDLFVAHAQRSTFVDLLHEDGL